MSAASLLAMSAVSSSQKGFSRIRPRALDDEHDSPAKKVKLHASDEDFRFGDEQKKDQIDAKSSQTPQMISVDVNASFASLGVCEQLVDACKALGWAKPSDIQRETLPWAMQG